jgi:hypothetical protein
LSALIVFAVSDFSSAADSKTEAAKFQGVWRFESTVHAGKSTAKDAREKMTIKFDEDRFTIRKDGSFAGADT